MPRLVILGLGLLALASLVLVLVVPRWVAVPGAVIVDAGFVTLGEADAAPAWQRMGHGRIEPIAGGVRLLNDDPESTVGLDQRIRIPAGIQAFRVTATVSLDGVATGPESWQGPRVVVQGVDRAGSAGTGGRFQLIDRDGTFGPERLSTIFPVASPLDEAMVMLRLTGATGSMEIRDLLVEAAVKPASRDLLRRALLTLWLGIGAWIGLALWWQSHDRLAASLVLGGLGALAVMVVLPQAVRQPLHDLLGDVAGGRRFEMLKPLLHVAGFAVLAMASRLAQPWRPRWLFVLAWLAAAGLLELAEIVFSVFDANDLVDMALNATGAMLGLAAAGQVSRWRRGRAGRPGPAALASASRRP